MLGLAGLVGAGRTELARTVFGLDRPVLGGEIGIGGKPRGITQPHDAIEIGSLWYRRIAGAPASSSTARGPAISRLPTWSSSARLGLSTPTASRRRPKSGSQAGSASAAPNMRVEDRARCGAATSRKSYWPSGLTCAPLLIFDEPTRGIDVGPRGEIYRIIANSPPRGLAVWMISSDMEEVIGISDRVAVMHEGQIAGFLDRSQLISKTEHFVSRCGKGK